jgi:hypothetical protein
MGKGGGKGKKKVKRRKMGEGHKWEEKRLLPW